ncbi:hypothetical protein PQS90_12640 [Pseudomonas sp. BLCC-B13]|mgnify:CR=1 FL=1|jgi:hypothetical protein|uniref:hypothetical protein n=1 Tax=Pseudomonas sp. BLCC-B13 TaxID=3025314 RepID=UPI00234ED85E|nr:hypothetical protein [Pseudomonas sp. BLCC-B13]MDC7825997.1 hypothetical protein [Pseudomonas sp. BLCC-B13]
MMIEAQLQALYLAALLLMVDCICCFIAAYRKNPTLGAVAGGGTAGALALVLLTRMVPFPMAALASIVVGSVVAWMKVKALSPVEVTHGES